MQVSVRSYLTAGVALVGAGAIAISPIRPADFADGSIQTLSGDAHLAALVNPIEQWGAIFETTFENAAGIGARVAADPVPILGNVAGNQLITAQVLAEIATTFGSGFIEGAGQIPANLAAAVDKIAAGEIQQGVGDLALAFLTPIVGAALPLLFGSGFGNLQAVLSNPLANATNVVRAIVSVETLAGVGLPLLFDAIAPVLQVGVTAQAVYDGIEAGDFEAVANALISFPGDMVNTILNGSDDPFIGNGGLLGENGLVNSLLTVRGLIADAIKPPEVTPAMALRATEAEALEVETEAAEAEAEDVAELVASVPESDDPGRAPAALAVVSEKVVDTVVLDVEVEATEADEPATVVAEVPAEDLAVEAEVEAVTEAVDAEESGQEPTVTEATVDRKTAWAQVREQRAEARAERQAQRAEARAERQAKRAERKAEREAKRAERKAERAAAKSDGDSSE